MSWIFFLLINPFSLLAYLAVWIAFSISWEYLGLWIASVIGILAIILFPFNRPYVDADFDFFGDFIIYTVDLILVVGFTTAIITRITKNRNSTKKRSASKLGSFLSDSSYGVLSAYFSYLFLTKFWHRYQPAWQAYGVVILGIALTILVGFIVQKSDRINFGRLSKKQVSTFIYSFAISIALAMVINLIFPILAIEQTKNVISQINNPDIKYCIQSNRKLLKSWLDLTPLTAWNKPNGDGGAGLRHAVLVLEQDSEYLIYHWSYRLRKWIFTSNKFEPGAFTIPDRLQCNPEKNYVSNLPFI